MRRVRRLLVGITVTALALAGSPSAASIRQSIAWIRSYGTGEFGDNIAHRVTVSPDGQRVFVTGESKKPGNPYPDIVTLAYDAATGSPIWMRRYDGPGHSIDYPTDMALDPGGATLYVGGWVGNGGGDGDYGTIAYDATTGDQLWVQVFDGPVGSFDALTALAVDPTQPLVFVTGWSVVDGLGGFDYLTFAYDASTGEVKWRRYYHAPSNKDDYATDVVVSHDGSTVYVTGASQDPEWECTTIAYDALGGSGRWIRRIHSRYPETNGCTRADVAPDDSTVFLAGTIGADDSDFLTLALNEPDGSVRWRRRWNGPAKGDDEPTAAALTGDGQTLYVTGQSTGSGTGLDYALLAYQTSTGTLSWSAQYNGPADGDDTASAIALSSIDESIFITGTEKAVGPYYDYDYATVAYGPSGSRLWVEHYASRIQGDDVAWWIAASPTSSMLYVTGMGNAPYQTLYTTIAYTG